MKLFLEGHLRGQVSRGASLTLWGWGGEEGR